MSELVGSGITGREGQLWGRRGPELLGLEMLEGTVGWKCPLSSRVRVYRT